MNHKKRNIITIQMLQFELRNVIGNPYVHIFGVGLPVFMAALISKVAISELPDLSFRSRTTTTIYLGMGTLIPMAAILMGYAVSYAQELDKGIPQRLELFGIKSIVSLSNRAVSELFFISAAFILFFLSGFCIADIELPCAFGFFCYIFCMLLLSLIFLMLAHSIACICRNFGLTYCVSMIIYFGFMMLGGLMGMTYENLPKGAQLLAKLLPVTYISRDFYQIWTGSSYNFVPMIQSYLFLGAFSGILLFLSLKRAPKRV